MMASLGGEERHGVSPELREMNRMVWGTQADVNSLYHVLPNMKEFDVHVGRGYTPVESYGRLLARFLEVAPRTWPVMPLCWMLRGCMPVRNRFRRVFIRGRGKRWRVFSC